MRRSVFITASPFPCSIQRDFFTLYIPRPEITLLTLYIIHYTAPGVTWSPQCQQCPMCQCAPNSNNHPMSPLTSGDHCPPPLLSCTPLNTILGFVNISPVCLKICKDFLKDKLNILMEKYFYCSNFCPQAPGSVPLEAKTNS